jgi:hypothetical protein
MIVQIWISFHAEVSLKKIETAENGDLAISEVFPFNLMIAINAEERKN